MLSFQIVSRMEGVTTLRVWPFSSWGHSQGVAILRAWQLEAPQSKCWLDSFLLDSLWLVNNQLQCVRTWFTDTEIQTGRDTDTHRRRHTHTHRNRHTETDIDTHTHTHRHYLFTYKNTATPPSLVLSAALKSENKPIMTSERLTTVTNSTREWNKVCSRRVGH